MESKLHLINLQNVCLKIKLKKLEKEYEEVYKELLQIQNENSELDDITKNKEDTLISRVQKDTRAYNHALEALEDTSISHNSKNIQEAIQELEAQLDEFSQKRDQFEEKTKYILYTMAIISGLFFNSFLRNLV
jgi:predicted nuclease with TOPRIM domain